MRPLAKTGCILFLCFSAASFFCAQIQFFISCCLLAAAVFLLLFAKKRGIAFCLIIAAAATAYLGSYTQLVFLPSQQYDQKTAELSGTITDLIPSQGETVYRIQVHSVDGKKLSVPFQAAVHSEIDLGADYYDSITTQAKLYTTSSSNTLSLEDRLKSKGVFLSAYPVEGSLVEHTNTLKKPPQVYFLRLRDRMEESISRLIGEPQSGLVQGILFGRTEKLSFDLSQDFRRAGLAHILAVSGLHLTILSQALLLFLYFCRVPRRAARIVTCLFVLGFMAMAGFTASVMRAGVTTIIYLTACFFGRESDGLNSLGGAAAVVLLLNPFAVADVSFLLSFSATLGILLLSGRLNRRLSRYCFGIRFLEGLCENFCVSLSAILFTIPVSVLVFREISVIAPVSNLVVSLIVPLLLVCGFLTGTVGILWTGGGELLGKITRSLAWSLSKIAEFFVGFPYAHLPLEFDFLKIWVCCTLVLIGIPLLFRRRGFIRFSALFSAIILLGGILSYQVFNRNTVCLAAIGNGFGYSIIISYQQRAIVIDCGGGDYSGRNAYDYLCGKGISTIDSLVLTKLDRENAQGAPFLVEQCRVNSLVRPEQGPLLGELSLAAEKAGTESSPLGSMRIAVDSACVIEVNTLYKEPVVTVRFPHFALAYSANAGSLAEVAKSTDVNILLTKSEINNSLKNLQDRYAIILNDTPSEQDDSLGMFDRRVSKRGMTEWLIGMEGKFLVRGDE